MDKTKFDPKAHHRRSVRLKEYEYSQPGAYFVTIVSYQRECLFGEIIDGEMRLNEFGKVVKQQWEKLKARFPMIELGAFVVMPNHVHGVIIIHDRRGTAENTSNDSPEPFCRAPTTQGFLKDTVGKLEQRSEQGGDILCAKKLSRLERPTFVSGLWPFASQPVCSAI